VQGLEGALQRGTERDGAAKHDSGRTTASVTPPKPPRRGRKLKSSTNIRVALADTYRKLEAGVLNANDANARVNVLEALLKAIEGTDLARQVEELKSQHEAPEATEGPFPRPEAQA
jgi:hypothetical protein